MRPRMPLHLVALLSACLVSGCEDPPAAETPPPGPGPTPVVLESTGEKPRSRLRASLGPGKWACTATFHQQQEVTPDQKAPLTYQVEMLIEYEVHVDREKSQARLQFQRVRITLIDKLRSGRHVTKDYDTDQPMQTPDDRESWEQIGQVLLGTTYTYHLAPDGRVLKVEGPDRLQQRLVTELVGIGQRMADALALISVDPPRTDQVTAYQLVLAGRANDVPEEPVGPGAAWRIHLPQPLPNVQAPVVRLDCSRIQSDDQIVVDAEMSYLLAEPVKRSKVSVQAAQYDFRARRTHSAETGSPIRLEALLEGMNRTSPAGPASYTDRIKRTVEVRARALEE